MALGIALASKDIAGVIASSAGYPDSRVRKTLTFPLFATAGTDDFNHLEMRRLDRELSTTHRLVIFTGGHVWLSSDLALQAVEWMELQAMKAGLKPRDDAEIDRLFASRMAAAGTATTRTPSCAAGDRRGFQGIKDVSAIRGARPNSGATKAFAPRWRESGTTISARRILRNIASMTDRLSSDDRLAALNELRQTWRNCPRRQRIPSTRRSDSWRGGSWRRSAPTDP